MKTFVHHPRLLEMSLEAHAAPRRHSLQALCASLHQVCAASLQSPEVSITAAVNQDAAAQLLVAALDSLQTNGGGDLAPKDYIYAMLWCEKRVRGEHTCTDGSDRFTVGDCKRALESQGTGHIADLARSLKDLSAAIEETCQRCERLGFEGHPVDHPVAALYLTRLRQLARPDPEAAREVVAAALTELKPEVTPVDPDLETPSL